jgi:hypothetical protein
MDTIALWIGWFVLGLGSFVVLVGALYAGVYWTTFWINESHHRIAESITGRAYLDLLRSTVEQKEGEKRSPTINRPELTPREKAKHHEESGMRCNCDLDKWQPTALTGHSHVCRIHKAATTPEKRDD